MVEVVPDRGKTDPQQEYFAIVEGEIGDMGVEIIWSVRITYTSRIQVEKLNRITSILTNAREYFLYPRTKDLDIYFKSI